MIWIAFGAGLLVGAGATLATVAAIAWGATTGTPDNQDTARPQPKLAAVQCAYLDAELDARDEDETLTEDR